MLDDILEQYYEVFDSKVGKMKDVLLKIPVPSRTKPIFYKVRPIPYSIKEKVDGELQRLVKEGIFEPLEYSEWAAFIVPVRISNGSVRICRDYKITVNKVTQCDKYPVPKTEGLRTTLNGDRENKKLDLSHAYQ